MNIDEVLNHVMGHIKEAIMEHEGKGKKREGNVVRTHKPTKGLLAQFKQMSMAGEAADKLCQEAIEKMNKAQEIKKAMDKKHKRIWAEVDKEFNIPANTDSRWNNEEKVIEVMDTVNGGHAADEKEEAEDSDSVDIDELIEELSR